MITLKGEIKKEKEHGLRNKSVERKTTLNIKITKRKEQEKKVIR